MSGSLRTRERNVLLLSPPSREQEFDHCVELLTPADPAHLNVWSLGFTLPADERLQGWEARAGTYPSDFRIVSGQPLAPGETVDREGADLTARFASVDDPKNLTRLGVELTRSLEVWEGDDNQTVVCFHSITTLLQHVSTERAYRFLYSFTNAVREFGAIAHYHVNPRVLDEQEMELFSTLFDAVVEPCEE